LVLFVKVQTGVRIESDVWKLYKAVCGRKKLQPSRPIEAFLRLVLNKDSALSVLSMMREAAKTRIDGVEAYARVLLDWFLHGKYWLTLRSSGDKDDDVPVETLLLDALKVVVNLGIRKRIEDALIAFQRQVSEKNGR
jgi:hypothetical protein